MDPDEAFVVEDGRRDPGEPPHDDRLLRKPLLAESTSDTGPDIIGVMNQDAPRAQSRSGIRNLECNNSNEVAEEESSSSISNSSSSSANGEDHQHQQQQQQDSNLASTAAANTNEDTTTTTTIGKEILEIAIPALAGLAIDPFMTVMDTIFVGRTSTNAAALAGMGSAAAVVTFAFYLFNFLCTITTPLVSQHRAAGDLFGALTIGRQVLSFALVLGGLLTLVLLIFAIPLLQLMGTVHLQPESQQYALSFLRIRALAAPAVLVISASTGILRGFLDTKTTLVILAGASTVNFGLNCLLIQSRFCTLGPTGSAIATTTADYTSALLLLGILGGRLPAMNGKLGSNQTLVAQARSFTTACSRSNNTANLEDEVLVSAAAATTEAELSEPLLIPTAGQENEEIDELPERLLTPLSPAATATDLADDTVMVPTTAAAAKIIITPTCTIPTWHRIQPLIVASVSVFVRSFLLQFSIAGAAAMATRSGGTTTTTSNYTTTTIPTEEGTNANATSNIAAHQIALQLWLLCSFICDALAAASQALVADRIGQQSPVGVRRVCRKILLYAVGLGLLLAALLSLGDGTGWILQLFTKDRSTQTALQPLLVVLIVAQPLNSFVFTADGILQGASEFTYQAKSMITSVIVAIGSFYGFVQYQHYHHHRYYYYYYYHTDEYNNEEDNGGGHQNSLFDDEDNDNIEINLIFVWYSLLILQFMRGLTSTWKLVQPTGPIDLFDRRLH